jgi:hypothetical protein
MIRDMRGALAVTPLEQGQGTHRVSHPEFLTPSQFLHDDAAEAERVFDRPLMAGKTGAPLLAHYCASRFTVVGSTRELPRR